MKLWQKLLILTGLTLLATLIHGYTFSTGDQAIYIPQVLSRVDPSLFLKDYAVSIPEAQFSFFFPLIASLIKLGQFDLQWFYFILYLLIRFFSTLMIFNLAKTILKSNSKAFLATAILSLPLPVGGTATTTFDIAFLPRFLIAPLLIYGLTQIIRNHYFQVAVITGLIFLIHPFSAVSLGLILLGSLIYQRQSMIKILHLLLTSLVVASPLLLLRLRLFLSHTQGWLMPLKWQQILINRLPYLFLSHWSIFEWLGLLLILLPILLQLKTPPVKAIFFTTIIFTLFYFVFSELLPLTPLIQLQPLRLWLFLVLLAPILLVDLDFKLGLVALALLIITRFPSSLPIELPYQNHREWDQLQFWVRDNTPKDSLILTPPHRSGFRVHSQRAIVAEIKDGSSGLYSYPFALEWQQRISQLHPLPTKSTPEISQIAQQHGADYLITFRDFPHPSFTSVFQTETFIIYKL